MRISKERFHRSLPQRVIPPRNNLIQVNEAHVLLLGHLPRPSSIVRNVPDDLAILPRLPRNRRTDNRDSSLSLRIRDILPQIPPIRMHRLVNLQDRIIDLLGLVPDTMQRPPRSRRIIERPIVVMSPLKENHVSRLHESQRLRPLGLHDVRPAAPPAYCAIVDVDLASIEKLNQRLAPTPLSIRPVGMAVPHG